MTKRTKASLETLDFNTALDRVFRGRCPQPGIAPDLKQWRVWVLPSMTVPVDDSISELINRSKKRQFQIKMRPREKIEIDGGADFCPYYAARCVIANAAAHATDVFRGRKQAPDNAMLFAELAKEAADLSKSYRAFTQKWKGMLFLRQANFDGATEDLDETEEMVEDALFSVRTLKKASVDVIESLSRLEQYAKGSRSGFALRGSPTDAWERAFIEQLGYFWYFLTDCTPTRGVDFGNFVNRSYASIGGDKDANFEHSIRTVLDKVAARPEDDRFDRDFQLQPDKIVHTINGRRAVEKRPNQDQLNHEILGYVAAALENGCFESQVRLERILRINPSYLELIKDFLPRLRKLPGWTEMPE